MTSQGPILVVAATARELAPADTSAPDAFAGITCGVGPVEAAVAATRAIADRRPRAVVQVGIAGARRELGLPPGTIVVGTHAVYTDLGDLPAAWATRTIEAPAALLEALRAALPAARFLPIGTSARVGGTAVGGQAAGCPACGVEAMEGFAVLRAAQHAGIPAIEVRAISNEIEEHDRTRWHFDTAFAAITAATPAIVHAVHAALSAPTVVAHTPDHA